MFLKFVFFLFCLIWILNNWLLSSLVRLHLSPISTVRCWYFRWQSVVSAAIHLDERFSAVIPLDVSLSAGISGELSATYDVEVELEAEGGQVVIPLVRQLAPKIEVPSEQLLDYEWVPRSHPHVEVSANDRYESIELIVRHSDWLLKSRTKKNNRI